MKRDYTKIDNINTSLRFKSTGFFSSWFNEDFFFLQWGVGGGVGEGKLINVFFSSLGEKNNKEREGKGGESL